MDHSSKETLQKIANTVRCLSADIIEKAQSGHPGMVLGAAELGTYLFFERMRYNPTNPNWPGRDRFVLSAGHGSMLLYSLLHLSGYDVTMEDLLNFRCLGSRTPGHPERGHLPGVETTTGPLGQGVAAAVGMAISQKLLAGRLESRFFNSKVYCLAGDGCLMEGVASEASSLAGTLRLENLVLVYDANGISLDGPVSECFTEDVAARYRAYGFRVFEADGHDFDSLDEAFESADVEQDGPVFILVRTVIGKGAAGKENSCRAHGGPLGPDEVSGLKKALGWPDDFCHVPAELLTLAATMQKRGAQLEKAWNDAFKKFLEMNSEQAALWKTLSARQTPEHLEAAINAVSLEPGLSTRKCSEVLINRVAKEIPSLLSLSADLSNCDLTWLDFSRNIVSCENWMAQQIKCGVREFAMAAIAGGIAAEGFFLPTAGTFLAFSDYMRNAMRLSSLMGLHVIYVFSHDSINLGEDGPTHQPIEHLMSLRLMPGLTVIRPCDENESKAAWYEAVRGQGGPVALCFTRNPVGTSASFLTAERAREGVSRGAYVLYESGAHSPDLLFLSSGWEVQPTLEAAFKMEKQGHSVRVVSMPSWELFEMQPETYRHALIHDCGASLKVSVEAGVSLGWQRYVGDNGLTISIEEYGVSAPMDDAMGHFGFTAEQIVQKVSEHVRASLSVG